MSWGLSKLSRWHNGPDGWRAPIENLKKLEPFGIFY
jgi:hypothetical protein